MIQVNSFVLPFEVLKITFPAISCLPTPQNGGLEGGLGFALIPDVTPRHNRVVITCSYKPTTIARIRLGVTAE
ncbi:MAG: hypothetical protein GWN01_05070 [Nitrosopumilaceae archaeon]|nr:hypothetical protein [Nitrosopumilaceae archaeon]NIU00315.1 hypothetical protein [Nitrosopumilaceae archaeon]NIU86717.1 hypothetical protein [Nitrosopumilaceae archaeon]NIV65418.1 hypothetical protein [Nitrosopumilaceae archaeon]NIX60917.1 hypothetical protein [Nitrosopumilaceae archaeon]